MWNDGNFSVRSITIYDFCNRTDGCIVGSAFSVMLDWIRNPISQLGTNRGQISIELRTPEGWAIERALVPPVF